MIKETRPSGLKLWEFFEKTRFPVLITLYWKKFPWITIHIADKKKQRWYP